MVELKGRARIEEENIDTLLTPAAVARNLSEPHKLETNQDDLGGLVVSKALMQIRTGWLAPSKKPAEPEKPDDFRGHRAALGVLAALRRRAGGRRCGGGPSRSARNVPASSPSLTPLESIGRRDPVWSGG
jgi:hypothetical protein